MRYGFKDYKKSNIKRNHLKMGDVNPKGERIDVNSLYIEKNGEPWIGIMGEYHFNRDNRENWEKELAKMKAGGITIVSTYLFWIYHEEIEGQYDFSGDLDIREFIETATKVGLYVVIRIGPWAHGECRNGGFPDWLVNKPFKLRDNNDEYMSYVKKWYERIYEEVKGLFYHEGGNIIAVQFENELVDNAPHIAELKKLALEIGYRAPIYTATGWNSAYGAELPVDEVMAVFGGYVDAPWIDHVEKLPPSSHYCFDTMRNDAAIGLDVISQNRADGWQLPYEDYPFATCELGCGLQSTHHRRVNVSGMDAYAFSLVKLGCGNNLVGYYMYHGGTNKIGKLSTFNESRATGYPNDYTIINYDFHTALSQYGEAREQYGLLNMLHLFINDFGADLAKLENVYAKEFVPAKDLEKLRYCMRTDGETGYVFVNHYQRLYDMKNVYDVVIDTGKVIFPRIDVVGDVSFFMPFNMGLTSDGTLCKQDEGTVGESEADKCDANLIFATVQPLCKLGNTYFFAAIDGIAPIYKFEGEVEFEAEAIGYEELSIICSEKSDSNEKAQLTDALCDYVKEINGIKIVTVKTEVAKMMRKLDGGYGICIGEKANLYVTDNKLTSVEEGKYTYYRWNGSTFEKGEIGEEVQFAAVSFESCEEPFAPQHSEELNYSNEEIINPGKASNGALAERKLEWIKFNVDTPHGFVEIFKECDCAQFYADGKLVQDGFYSGEAFRLKADMFYGKESYGVFSESFGDYYIDK